MSQATFDAWRQERLAHFETIANQLLPVATQPRDKRLIDAMRYALLDGGKRVRALLAYAAGSASQARPGMLDRVAMALECIHAYSLVHDDLPSMDNDDLRRGKPTVHKAFDEATAVLAGDALQTHAFMILSSPCKDPAMGMRLINTLAFASGHMGMCQGQMQDIEMIHEQPGLGELESMQALKTGALISAAVTMGAQAGYWEQLRETSRLAFADYGKHLGVLFQIVDDILDCTQNTEVLGKTAGKDAKDDKPTWVSLLGLPGARQAAQLRHYQALEALDNLKVDPFIQVSGVEILRSIADLVIERTN